VDSIDGSFPTYARLFEHLAAHYAQLMYTLSLIFC
jgi:hypothetical protein